MTDSNHLPGNHLPAPADSLYHTSTTLYLFTIPILGYLHVQGLLARDLLLGLLVGGSILVASIHSAGSIYEKSLKGKEGISTTAKHIFEAGLMITVITGTNLIMVGYWRGIYVITVGLVTLGIVVGFGYRN